MLSALLLEGLSGKPPKKARLAMLPAPRKSASRAVLCVPSSVGLIALCPASLQGQYSPVYVSGPSSNRVDMVFMGDGYRGPPWPDLGTYQNVVQTLWTYLFGPPPPPPPPSIGPVPSSSCVASWPSAPLRQTLEADIFALHKSDTIALLRQ